MLLHDVLLQLKRALLLLVVDTFLEQHSHQVVAYILVEASVGHSHGVVTEHILGVAFAEDSLEVAFVEDNLVVGLRLAYF